ncbi:MAG: RraA family protein [Verrucomicrobiae bacterium]|nr:RraA family protein [Verrucomicrobiae bacterium]
MKTATRNSSRLVKLFGPRIVAVGATGLCALFCLQLSSEERRDDSELRRGKHFILPKVYSLEEDRAILRLFEGLRVADVSDGMDKAGLSNTGRMDPEIQPLWRDTKNFTHRIVGVAVTARYVPTQEPASGPRETAEFDRWMSSWYREKSSEPFVALLREGSVLVIEEHGADVGSIGSNNILSWKKRGCVGVVSSSTARDTDEIITEAIPLYFKRPGRGVRPGRNEIESVNMPIVCGGVLVMPGDIIVAEGDGVVLVPRAKAEEVAA